MVQAVVGALGLQNLQITLFSRKELDAYRQAIGVSTMSRLAFDLKELKGPVTASVAFIDDQIFILYDDK
jgi:hypothetical protein